MKKRLTVITSLAVTFGCAFVLATTHEPGTYSTSRAERTLSGEMEATAEAASLPSQSAGIAGADAPIQNGPAPGSDTYRVLEDKDPSGHDRLRAGGNDRWRNASSCTDAKGVLHARESLGFQACVNEKRKYERDTQQGGHAASTGPIVVPNEAGNTGIPLGGTSRGSSATEN